MITSNNDNHIDSHTHNTNYIHNGDGLAMAVIMKTDEDNVL